MRDRILNVFPIFGGVTGGTIEGIHKGKYLIDNIIFYGIDETFIMRVLAAAVIGGIAGFIIQKVCSFTWNAICKIYKR